jgi:hypothetical protein
MTESAERILVALGLIVTEVTTVVAHFGEGQNLSKNAESTIIENCKKQPY